MRGTAYEFFRHRAFERAGILRAARTNRSGVSAQPVRRFAGGAARQRIARSSSPTTKAHASAKASRGSPTCRRWPSARAIFRRACSGRRSTRSPVSRSRATGSRRVPPEPDRPRDRGALSRTEPQCAVPELRVVADQRDRRDQFDARIDHALTENATDGPVTASATGTSSSRSRARFPAVPGFGAGRSAARPNLSLGERRALSADLVQRGAVRRTAESPRGVFHENAGVSVNRPARPPRTLLQRPRLGAQLHHRPASRPRPRINNPQDSRPGCCTSRTRDVGKGRHFVKVGGESGSRTGRLSRRPGARVPDFASQSITGNALADLLLVSRSRRAALASTTLNACGRAATALLPRTASGSPPRDGLGWASLRVQRARRLTPTIEPPSSIPPPNQ